MIEQLARSLAAAVPRCAAEEIADIMWLLTAIGEEPGSGAAQARAQERSRAPAQPDPGPDEREVPSSGPGDSRAGLSLSGKTGPAAGGRITPATAVGFRAPPSITHPLVTVRALSSFRRIHRPGTPEVDIDATIEASADAGQLVVVTSPSRERGLDVALVVDTSPVMTACRPAMAQFERLLRQSGAFRSVSQWTLVPAQVADGLDGAGPERGMLIRDGAGTDHHPDRLLEPSGQRLILVATDALAEHWYTPGLWQVLSRWARLMPTAIVHVLPARYRGQTALGDSIVFTRARRPAGPNSTAEVQAAWWSIPGDGSDAEDTPLPVVALAPEALAAWSQATTTGTAWVEAIWAHQPARPAPREVNAQASAGDRVRAFQERASAGAQTLARVLAGAQTLSWQLIAVLQAGLVPSTGPMELAEVLAGGLLERADADAIPDQTELFQFMPGVDTLLRRGTSATQQWETYELISNYLEKTVRSGADFHALLADPHGSIEIDAGLEPFAALGRAAAARLGVRIANGSGPTPPAVIPAVIHELPFGELLRRLRVVSEMTQEELALKAGLSTRTIADLERGVVVRPRSDTSRQLADALHLDGIRRTEFVSAARRYPSEAAVVSLPRDIASFTGRESELSALTIAASERSAGAMSVCSIEGMAGVGKTALAVHAAHQLAPQFPDGQLFLSLHGHTLGRAPVTSAEALSTLLRLTGVAASQIPAEADAMASMWRDRLVGKKMLLLFDDALDSSQVQPLLPGTSGSLVIVTSRRRLSALERSVAISLDLMPPNAAAELFVRLAGRPGLDAGDSALAELCRNCGYLPLAIGLIASQMRHHPAWSVEDLAADLAMARDRLEAMQAENLSVAAAFELSYRDLSRDQRRMFRRLGLHPGVDIDAYAAAALDDVSLREATDLLGDLYDNYLLAELARGRYRLHDLIRQHAQSLAATDPAEERADAIGRLLDYYLYTVNRASRLLRGAGDVSLADQTGQVRPAHMPEIANHSQAVAWLSAERLNLEAVASSAAAHGTLVPGAISAGMHTFLRSQGYWNQAMTMHRAALDIAREAGSKQVEARALTDLGSIQNLTNDYAGAEASLRAALRICVELDDRLGQADALRELGQVQLAQGDYGTAESSISRALDLFMSVADRIGEADALRSLGAVHQARGQYREAAQSLDNALKLYSRLDDRLGRADALIEIGAIRLATGDIDGAARKQLEALTLYRELGDRYGQANALTQLGAVQQKSGAFEEAKASLNEAIELHRTLGDQLGEADTLNSLGELALRTGDHVRATEVHEQARAIAARIGAPREQARAHEGIGRSYLAVGQADAARTHLEQAAQIYERIGSPSASRAARLLADAGGVPDSA